MMIQPERWCGSRRMYNQCFRKWDTYEILFNSRQKQRTEYGLLNARPILGRVNQIKAKQEVLNNLKEAIQLCVEVRAGVDVAPLNNEDSRTLFLAVAGQKFQADPYLDAVINTQDGLPLALELLALRAEGEPGGGLMGHLANETQRAAPPGRRRGRPDFEPRRLFRGFLQSGTQSGDDGVCPTAGVPLGRSTRRYGARGSGLSVARRRARSRDYIEESGLGLY